MPLTRDFKETIRDRFPRDSKFRKELLRMCLEAMLSGDITLAKTILRDSCRGSDFTSASLVALPRFAIYGPGVRVEL
jgi:hypothetical protein